MALLLAAAMSLGFASLAFAQSAQTYTAEIGELNGSGASGTAAVTVEGNQATVEIESAGLAPGAPHAQHIHIGGQNVCPPASADTDGTGTISVAEGQPFYGDIQVSLTTAGDVSADSGLAVERMPVANADGTLSYSRTFTLPSGITAADLEGGVIVQHGIDFNVNGEYDAEAGQSSIMPELPFEATAPATCGELASSTALPDTGGVSLTMIALTGGSALLAVALMGGYLVRRFTA
ncbi:MAG: hypothetical protein WA990_11800 [Rubrobacteraceae bacterium]